MEAAAQGWVQAPAGMLGGIQLCMEDLGHAAKAL